ncbi:hypothetical protein GIB67_040282 [Kingdonia uniflora]|uniref:non-specific serine/threonine protein kinase n=1 Tax=Kingdonia uniflora TaxID=39325 RepID=A0A7J7MVP9_9MAGN|nr:hypothetical protein GIB67_040282 [Kingdonia uniflora]
MWRFKPFTQKEQGGLEGRTVDIGNLKVHIRNTIAEGGFSCVYLARDAIHPMRQYALKQIICNDQESLDLAMKEILVMKLLVGHPNVVSLQAHTVMDMGRTKEALLVMDYCEKSLVNVLESRGTGYYEEKQILLMFRDVCNAVYAMHCQFPPIAHSVLHSVMPINATIFPIIFVRDLKAENILLGHDGLWKVCDFGSISTNHQRFERPEDMGIEEDNIRKHTTPAYRAPEMWDLFRRELINEKVDIWALGCLLYRICYFKSAFDGESKLQILNGNYRIPELPKYSSFVTDLIKDMLQASPDARPDITQARALLDCPFISMNLGPSTHARKSPPPPHRNPPPPPSKEKLRNLSPSSASSMEGGVGGGQLGAFWSTQHAKNSNVTEDKSRPLFDEEPLSQSTSKYDRRRSAPGHSVRKSVDGSSEDFEIRFFPEDSDRGSRKSKASQSEKITSQDETFNTFVAEFDTSKFNTENNNSKVESDVDRLTEQLKQANLEKAEITSKYEKLSAICRSQRQEIQELKQNLAARIPSPNKDPPKNQISSVNRQSVTPPREKNEGTVWELQQGMFTNSTPSPNSKQWQPFADETKAQPMLKNAVTSKSVRTTNGQHSKPAPISFTSGTDAWGFDSDNFTALPGGGPQISRTPTGQGNTSQRFNASKNLESKKASQPAGWAGF